MRNYRITSAIEDALGVVILFAVVYVMLSL
jgi:hypothetical protein